MYNWKPGDPAVICNDHTGRHNGRIVEIIVIRSYPELHVDCIIDVPDYPNPEGGTTWGIGFINLKPIPDDDAKKDYIATLQKSSWKTLEKIWQPKELERVR